MRAYSLSLSSFCLDGQPSVYLQNNVSLLFLVLSISLDHDSQKVLGHEAKGEESEPRRGDAV